ncbi:hypothetical protein M8494_11670 [Serratia ureilytica]
MKTSEHGIDKIDLSGLRFNNSLSELRFYRQRQRLQRPERRDPARVRRLLNGTTDLLMNTQSNNYAADFKIAWSGR